MFTTLIFKEANFHIYKINEKCEVMKNDELLDSEDYIYHSTNGYDYILIEKLDGAFTMYPMDQVVYNSFNTIPIVDGYKCIHIDGNLRNNNLYNLERVEDIEEWRVVTYPGVPIDEYEISSHGNIRKINSCFVIKTYDRKGYLGASIKTYKWIHVSIHRLVAHEFIYNIPDGYFINHIDNDGYNNKLLNLEIVTPKQNTDHAKLLEIGNTLDHRIVEIICKCLIKHNGSVKRVYDELNTNGMCFSKCNIETVKYKYRYRRISDKYFSENQFEKNMIKLSSNDVHMICKYIIKYNGSLRDVYNQLKNDGINYITFSEINNIKNKHRWSFISDQYFDKHTFDDFKAKLDVSTIREICKCIVDNNGCVKDIMRILKLNNITIDRSVVYDIKYKKRYIKISDMYFTRNQFCS